MTIITYTYVTSTEHADEIPADNQLFNTEPLPKLPVLIVGENEVVDETPIINATRSVRIVFTADSAVSILAGSIIKRLVASIEPGSIADKTYTFEFQEVGTVRPNQQPTDVCIWLDTPAVFPNDETKNMVLIGNGAGEWSESAFSEAFEDYAKRAELPLRSMVEGDEPAQNDAYLYLGIMMNSVSAFSMAAPEVEIPMQDELIGTLSDFQNELCRFYTNNVTAYELLNTFGDICDGMRHLGLPTIEEHMVIDNGLSLAERVAEGEAMAVAYMRAFTHVRDQAINHGVAQHVRSSSGSWIKSSKVLKVLTTRIPEFFWLTLRIPAMQAAYYHNSRFVGTGIQVATNLPVGCSPVQQALSVVGSY